MRNLRPFFIIGLLAFIPTIPFVIFGYRGHDYLFHLESWLEMRQAWLHGVLAPGWAALANYNLGDPRFCFYPPVSFWIGTFLSFVIPFRWAPGAFVWLAFVVAGSSMYAVCGAFVQPDDRLKVAVLYMASPYLLLTAINRFAASELCVQAWAPLVILGFFRSTSQLEKRAVLWFGALLGLTVITNIPAFIVMFYTFFATAVLLAARQRSFFPIMHYLAAAGVGAALAAFYFLPAISEQQWIQAWALSIFDYRSFFIFAPISQVGDAPFKVTCWLIAIVGISLVISSAAPRWRSGDRTLHAITSLGILAFLFQLSVTDLLWQYLPKLNVVQFPWRFNLIIGVAVPLTTFAKSVRRSIRIPAFVALGLTSTLPFVLFMLHFVNASAHAVAPLRFQDFISAAEHGYSSNPEYVPAGGKLQETPPPIPEVSVVDGPSSSNYKVSLLSIQATHESVSVDCDTTCNVRLARFFYPYWQSIDDSGEHLIVTHDAHGLLVLTVPPGKHVVQIQFRARSLLRTSTAMFSFISAIILLIGLLFSSRSTFFASRKVPLTHIPA